MRIISLQVKNLQSYDEEEVGGEAEEEQPEEEQPEESTDARPNEEEEEAAEEEQPEEDLPCRAGQIRDPNTDMCVLDDYTIPLSTNQPPVATAPTSPEVSEPGETGTTQTSPTPSNHTTQTSPTQPPITPPTEPPGGVTIPPFGGGSSGGAPELAFVTKTLKLIISFFL
jgi:hypothetical protein